VPEHALLVPFRELAAAVEPWLERTVTAKPSHGIPPHVTLLYPCPGDVEGIGGVLVGREAFDVEFRRLERFPDVLWLAPEPAEPFAVLGEALVGRYPGFPPYRGAVAEIIPHLTVAQAAFDEAAAAIEPLLPLRGRACGAALLERVEPDRWREVATFRFGGP